MTKVYLAYTQAENLSCAARLLLAQALGFVPQLRAGDHGKPYLVGHPEIECNLSHTKGLVACAISKWPVGVDVEQSNRQALRIAARFFTPCERAGVQNNADAVRVWTRKEALLKRDGRGISVQLDTVETQDHPELYTWQLDEYFLSVCCSGPAPTLCWQEICGKQV